MKNLWRLFTARNLGMVFGGFLLTEFYAMTNYFSMFKQYLRDVITDEGSGGIFRTLTICPISTAYNVNSIVICSNLEGNYDSSFGSSFLKLFAERITGRIFVGW